MHMKLIVACNIFPSWSAHCSLHNAFVALQVSSRHLHQTVLPGCWDMFYCMPLSTDVCLDIWQVLPSCGTYAVAKGEAL